MTLTRAMSRGLVIGAVVASVFGATAARGQIADTKAPRVKATPVVDTTKPGPKGMAVQRLPDGRTQARMTLLTTNVVTTPCTASTRSKVRLGILNNSAVYTHCDFP